MATTKVGRATTPSRIMNLATKSGISNGGRQGMSRLRHHHQPAWILEDQGSASIGKTYGGEEISDSQPPAFALPPTIMATATEMRSIASDHWQCNLITVVELL